MLNEKGCFNDLMRCSLNYSVEACDDLLISYILLFCRFSHGDKTVQTALIFNLVVFFLIYYSCRYPAHSQVDGRWRFPGIGEFQCYDKYM